MSKLVKSSLSLQAWTTQDLLNCKVTAEGKLVRYGERLSGRHSEEKPGLALRSLTSKETAHLRAAYYWLNGYRPNLSDSPTEQIKGFLEAAQDLQQLQAWELVSEILLCTPHSSISQPLHIQLGTWGLLREQIALYEPLIGKVNPALDSICLNGLGKAHTYLSNYPEAVESYQSNLQLTESNKSNLGRLETLEGLGFCYLYWGKYKPAQRYYLEHLSLSNKIQLSDDFSRAIQGRQARVLAGLGYIMYFLRQFRKGVRYSRQSLKLAGTIQDVQSQWMALGAMAICYSQRGKHRQASDCLKKRLALSSYDISAHDRLTGLIDLGATYCYQLKFKAAIDCLQEVITEAKKLGNVRGQCQALMLLGFIYCWQDKEQLSIEKSEQCLNLSKRFDFEQFESQSCSQLSYVYSSIGEVDEGIIYANQALQAAHRVKSKDSLYKACGLMVLGLAKIEQGEFWSGIQSIAASFIKLPPWAAVDSRIIFALFVKRVMNWLIRK